MKTTHICPKCNSTDILRIEGNVQAYGVGNNIQVGLLKNPVLVNRYLCCSCGFSEEWIDLYQEDIENLKKKYQ